MFGLDTAITVSIIAAALVAVDAYMYDVFRNVYFIRFATKFVIVFGIHYVVIQTASLPLAYFLAITLVTALVYVIVDALVMMVITVRFTDNTADELPG